MCAYIELLSILLGLQELAVVQVVTAFDLGLQPWLDGLVLVVEVGQVGHQVLHDEHVGQRVDLGRLAALVDEAQAGQGVAAVDVHGTGAADALAARTAKSQRRILLVLDLQKNKHQVRAKRTCTLTSYKGAPVFSARVKQWVVLSTTRRAP
jgi:hypothetical protein